MSISFSVEGLPPKKDGADSMWGKPVEIPRLIALRTAAHAAMGGQPLFREPLCLRVQVAALPHEGDLDNFIMGICDGLMAAHARTPGNHPDWASVPAAIQPSQHIVYTDDACIARIEAARRAPEGSARSYTTELTRLA